MTDLTTLVQQKADLEAQIAAHKPVAISQVVALMQQLGLTWADFGMAPIAVAKPAFKRAVKYRDEQGHTWTGVGQRPRWLTARLKDGADLEQFRVKAG